ncbi:MAG: hypothetical protein HY663_05190 [Chloroflexi bacterium]|nr:hypothetical protein [Chloroflexota bacterium]
MSTTRSREELIEEEKRLKGEIENRNGKTVEELYREREKRLYDTLQLKVPDRVPVVFGANFFACKYSGLPYSTAYYDAPAWKAAFKRVFADLEPDAYSSTGAESGTALEALDSSYTRWPGGNLPPDVGNQVVEQEFMKEDEYDLFLADPSDFIVRVWLPRVYGSMKPLAKLPPLMNLGTNVAAMTTIFASDEFEKFARAMKRAGAEEVKWDREMRQLDREMASLGFPQSPPARGGVQPPFSGFSNTFRTWRGVVRDMFRQPEKLKAALNRFVEYRIATASPAIKKEGRPAIGNCGESHRVSDEFMSPKQFEEFVWPYWKRCVEATLNLGYDIVSMFFEGRRDKQLEYFTEFPKGSLFIAFAETDMARAKAILGDRACLMGNVPITLLQMGSPSEVEEYCKNLIKVCGKNGGFILRASTNYTQEAKPENVKAMIDSVKKYGWY